MPWPSIDRWLAPAPGPPRVEWLRQHTYAHRGLHGDGRIENSASACAAAVAAGLGIECDVQRSADGHAIVFHDWDLGRLTGIRGAVLAHDAATLGAMRLAGSADAIWTLPRLLCELRGQVPLLVEIKSRREVPFAPLCRAVAEALAGYPGLAAVMSFDPRVSRWFARHQPAIVRGLVVTEGGRRTRRGRWRRRWSLWQARPDFLACDVRDLPSPFATGQRRRGLPVLTWTVSDEATLRAARLHADAPIAEGAGLAAAIAMA